MDLHWSHWSSVRHFPERSWTVVTFPCWTVVKSFTRWCTLLLLFFLRFSSFSLHCSPIQFSLAFFMPLLMLLFTSLYFSDPSGANLFFLSSLLLSHRSRIYAVTQGFFLLTMFAKDLTGCFSHCIGSRTITNLRFADDIDGVAGEEEELVNLVKFLDKASTAYGM